MNKEKTQIPRVKSFIRGCVLCGAMALTLSACVPAMLAGGGAAGASAATDRRTFGTQAEDKVLGFKAEGLADAIVGSKGHVNVTSFNRVALLTGEVPSEAMKLRVGSEIGNLPNVRKVENHLEVAPPSSLGSRSGDTMITAKVSASFVDTKGLYANSLKTVTEQGVVFLMGRVTEKEGDLAATVASKVSGVKKVVKVFEHITEEELNGMKSQEAPADAEGSESTQAGEDAYR